VFLSNIFPGMSFGDRLEKTLLPALTLTLVVTAHMMRMTRAAIINLLASPYIEMARLKGLSPMRGIVVHALPNALAGSPGTSQSPVAALQVAVPVWTSQRPTASERSQSMRHWLSV